MEGDWEGRLGTAIGQFWLEWWWLFMTACIFVVLFLGHLESRWWLFRESRRLRFELDEVDREADRDAKWQKFQQVKPVPHSEIDSLRVKESIRVAVILLVIIAFLLGAIIQQLIYRF